MKVFLSSGVFIVDGGCVGGYAQGENILKANSVWQENTHLYYYLFILYCRQCLWSLIISLVEHAHWMLLVIVWGEKSL